MDNRQNDTKETSFDTLSIGTNEMDEECIQDYIAGFKEQKCVYNKFRIAVAETKSQPLGMKKKSKSKKSDDGRQRKDNKLLNNKTSKSEGGVLSATINDNHGNPDQPQSGIQIHTKGVEGTDKEPLAKSKTYDNRSPNDNDTACDYNALLGNAPKLVSESSVASSINSVYMKKYNIPAKMLAQSDSMSSIKRHKSNFAANYPMLAANHSYTSHGSLHSPTFNDLSPAMPNEMKPKAAISTVYESKPQSKCKQSTKKAPHQKNKTKNQNLPTILHNRMKGVYSSSGHKKISYLYKPRVEKEIIENKFSTLNDNHKLKKRQKEGMKLTVHPIVNLLKAPAKRINKIRVTTTSSILTASTLHNDRSGKHFVSPNSPVVNQVKNPYVACYRSGYSAGQRLVGKKKADSQFYKLAHSAVNHKHL